MPKDNEKKEKIEKLAGEVLNLSRNTLAIHLRFLDRAVSMLQLQSLPDLAGMKVNGSTIFYDPVRVLTDYRKERSRVPRAYLHMILHCVYQHYWTSPQVDQDCWDLACDIAVEDTISSLDLPALQTRRAQQQKEVLDALRSQVRYMTADMLYRYFMNADLSAQEIGRLRALFGTDAHGDWYRQEDSQKRPHKKEGSGKNKENSDQESESEGSSGESSDEDEEEDSQEGDPDEIPLGPPAGGGKKRLQDWKDTARQMKMDLESFSKGKGDAAGSLLQNLRSVTREKYDYRAFLKKFAALGERMKINQDEFDYIFYTYGLKLYGKMPLIEPLEYKETKQIREFVIAIDTSGSTAGDLVQTFLQKTYNILKQEESFGRRFNLHIIQCDADIQTDIKISNQNEFDRCMEHMQLRGMGGTDFRPVFNYVDELIEKKEFTNLKGLIYFTDGYGIFPPRQPAYKTAFVYIEEGYENPQVPPWAIKLVLQPEDIGEI